MATDRVSDAVWEALRAMGGRKQPNPDAALRALEGQGLKTAEVRQAVAHLYHQLRERMTPYGHTAEGTLRINPEKLSPQARKTMGLVPGQLEWFAKNTKGIAPEMQELLVKAAERGKKGDLSGTAVKAPALSALGVKRALLEGKGPEAVDRLGMMQSLLSRAGRTMEGESLGAMRREIPWTGTVKRDAPGQMLFKTKGELAGVPVGKLDALAERMRDFMLDRPETRGPMAEAMERENKRADGPAEEETEKLHEGAGKWEERRKGPRGFQGQDYADEEPPRRSNARRTEGAKAAFAEEAAIRKDRAAAERMNDPRKYGPDRKVTPEYQQNELVRKFLDERHPEMGAIERSQLLGPREAAMTEVGEDLAAKAKLAVRRGKVVAREGLGMTGLEGAVNMLPRDVAAKLAAGFRRAPGVAKAVVEGARTPQGKVGMMMLPKLLAMLKNARP